MKPKELDWEKENLIEKIKKLDNEFDLINENNFSHNLHELQEILADFIQSLLTQQRTELEKTITTKEIRQYERGYRKARTELLEEILGLIDKCSLDLVGGSNLIPFRKDYTDKYKLIEEIKLLVY